MIINQEKIQRMIGGGASGNGSGSNIGGSDLVGYATQAWVNENYLSIEFFSSLFKAYDSASTPNEIAPNNGDTTAITNIKAMFGFWTEQYLSALGLNSAGGGGGATSLADLLDVSITSPTNGQALVYNTTSGKWENQTIGGGSTGTLSSIGFVMPTGFSVSPGTLTEDGSFTVSFSAGYGLPLTADVNKGVTAYGWGNHANAGYLTSVDFSDLTSHPTTLAGYGITDAKIASGTITLGSNTITPWTNSNHPSTIAGYSIGDAYINNGAIVLGTNSITPWTTNNHPTTLAGYGINNAYISNGSIVLGTNTITPWTNSNHPSTLSGYGISDATFGTQGTNYIPITLGNVTKNVLLTSALSDYLPLSGGAMTGSLAMKGIDIYLATSGSSSDDSADLEWVYGNNQEKARIWFDNQYTATKGPNFRLYQKDGTQLYNGTLATVDSNVASATKLQTARKLWGNNFDGTADVTGAIHLQNGNTEGLWMKDAGGTDRKVLGLDSGTTSSLQIGWDMRGYGTTNIHGNQVSFHVGALSGGITAGNFSSSGILHIARDLFLDTNNRGVVFTKSDGTTQVNGIYVDGGNNFVLGANMITSSMNSYLRGSSIRLQSGSTNADTLILDSNRNVIFAQNNSGLYMRDTLQENRNILQLNSQNVLAIGYGTGSPDYFTHLYGGSTNGIRFYCYDTLVAGVQNKTVDNVSVKGLYIGDGLIQWDSQNNALKILKKDGTAASLYATGGVSALGFAPIINSLDAFTITNLTTSTVTSTNWNITSEGNAKFKKMYLDDTRYIYLYGTPGGPVLMYYDGTTNKAIQLS